MPVLVSLLIYTGVEAQQLMLLQNTRNLKNYKYYPGDIIHIKVITDNRVIEGAITCLTDSTVCIGEWEEVKYSEIKVVYRDRLFIPLLSGLLLTGGVAYFAVDSFNRLINDDAPVIQAQTVAISGGLVALSFGLMPLKYRRINTKTWKIGMLDFNNIAVYHRPTTP